MCHQKGRLGDWLEVRTDDRKWHLEQGSVWSVLARVRGPDMAEGEQRGAALIVSCLGQWCVLPGSRSVRVTDAGALFDELRPVRDGLELHVESAAGRHLLTFSPAASDPSLCAPSAVATPQVPTLALNTVSRAGSDGGSQSPRG